MGPPTDQSDCYICYNYILSTCTCITYMYMYVYIFSDMRSQKQRSTAIIQREEKYHYGFFPTLKIWSQKPPETLSEVENLKISWGACPQVPSLSKINEPFIPY